ncbi:MAG: glutamyl-tRNA reductase, partial [Verrucomicrobia bacterium]|nr:glutamyl-tRNA reductase [Verrucomicrobiota bacterium]
MNLFCVGLSHHTANVETRERFAGGPGAECPLREAGCTEALVLSTCNRVEVYGASEKRVSTDEIARCLLQKPRVGDRGHSDALSFYRYEAEKCV